MNTYKKTAKFVALVLALFFTMGSSNLFAEPTCGGTTTIESQEITKTPELDCLEIKVFGSDCPNSAGISFTNNCDTQISVEGDDGFNITLEPKDSIDHSFNVEDDVAEKISYTATSGEDAIEIEFTVTASVQINSTSTDATCSTTQNRDLNFILLIGFGFLIARRKK